MLLLVMALLSPLAAQAQGNYVYVNNQAAANTVSGYSVSTTGALTQLSGSPFSTGGVGANVVCYGLSRIVLSPVNNLLFVANTGDRSITAFQINPASGVLTRAAGSPFATALTLDTCQGISLAATPDGNYLFASSNGQIETFTIGAGGTLAQLGSIFTPPCCSPNAGMVISPNGQFLAISNQTSVSMFTITAGVLAQVQGSPFAKTGSGSLSGLDFSCAADRLYGGEATGSPALADAWTVDNSVGTATSGVLTPVPGTPFTSSGNNSNLVLSSPDNSLLFQSNQFTNSVNSFTINPDGSLLNVGKFGTTAQVHTPAGMATDATGTFLYVADDAFGVAVFRIGNGGVLAALSDLAINRPGEIQDLVAYPARSCTTADLKLEMTALSPTAPAGAPVQFNLKITNNSTDTISSAVVGDTFPPTLSAGGSAPIVNPAGASRQNDVTNNVYTVTITTTVPHLLAPGQTVTISSVPAPTTPNPIQPGFFLSDPTFTGVYQVIPPVTANTFTYLQQKLSVSSFPSPTLAIVATNGAQRLNGTVTITTTQPFQFPASPQQTLAISNVANSSFNTGGVQVPVTQIAPTKFTYAQAGSDAVSGGGTATAPTNVPKSDTAGGGTANSATCLVTQGNGTCSFANFAPRPVIVANTGANRSGNVVTITTTAPHQIFAGQSATISGVANTTFNGVFTVVSVPTPTTFTYKQTAANAISGGGSVSVPATQAQLITFPSLAPSDVRTFNLNATTKSNLTNETVITNTANITNKSTVDPDPSNNSPSATITIGTQTGTTLTVPTATGPFGGNATVTATLKTSSGTPVPNETIGFNFNQNNSNYNAVTDGNGVATAIVPLGFTTVGTHPQAFTVTFGGDASFAASSALGDLIVTKAQLTVTADNQSRLYGDPNPTFTYVITGFVNGDDISVVSGAADCTSTATQASPVGSYPITCAVGTLSAQNYVFAFVPGTLTINPAPLTVNVDSVSRAYGDPNPTFTGTITGLKNGDVITANYTTTATQLSPVGTYPITATLVDPNSVLGNYTVTINNGTLTITPAALVITADNAARLYGDPNPAFSGTIAGIKNGDNITAIYTTPATPASPIGTYPIIPSPSDNGTGALANYVVTLNNGSLTVSPAPLTVTADNATRAFGAPNPTFTGTIVGIKNGDNITATYSTPATANSPAGTYPIIPALVDPTGKLGNYTVTINNGTLTVTTAILTVTANNASRFYGDQNPLFTGTIQGIQNGDNITATYSSVADPTSPVGTYAIVPTLSDNGTGALANYAVVSNNGILTVNPAPLTVTAISVSRLYGDANPALSVTIAGIKNGDPITASVSTTADPTSPIGTYPIVATLIDPTNKLGNYAVTINNGTLTVNPAPLSVTAANASRLFGTPNPPFSGIITGIKNGDPITATYSTTAIATSPAGTYPITPALVDPAAKLGNYTVTSTNGTLTVNAAPTANFVFVNNQAAAGNSIAGYSVAVDGTLTALAGSPLVTGGLGANAACSSVNRLALSAGNNLLFVSNGGDQTISAFQIDPTSGALTAAAGSPFASSLTLDACSGISLSATPDGRFLMASSNGQITTFSIGAGGVLTSLSTAANPVVPNASMKISANGQLLAVSNGASVSVFSINPDGSLTAVAGSPFAEAGTGSLAGLDFSSTSGLLFGAEASATAAFADAWTIGTNGALSSVAGSPFSTTAINSNVVLLSPNDSFLFASNQGSNSVSSYSVNAGGSLAGIGSFGSASSLHAPVGMATDRSGSLLFVADDTFGVAVFSIDGAGSLSQLGDVAIANAGQVQDLVAYPPRMASNADLSVAISASSPNIVAGQNVTYTISVTNNGADPAAATITDSLPSGFSLVSCSATGNGACVGASSAANFYLLQSGETQTVTLVAQAGTAIPDGTVTTDTASVSNSSAVDANAANNSASATVTVAQPATTTLAVAPASGAYGGSTTLSATLSTASGPLAGQTVSFTLNGTAVGSAVTDATGLASVPASLVGIGAGSYPAGVAASYAGDPNNKASSGSAALTVNPALLTVTAANAIRLYGDPDPTFTFTFSGFVNGETASVVTGSPSCTTTAVATSPLGTYPITCAAGTLSAANYTFTFVDATLTINPAPLTVTAANASRVYGDPNPTFTGTITGIKNGDNITAVYATTATAASVVGTYPITPGLVDPTNKLGNYTVTSNNGTLTITPAPLTVTAANATKAFGDPNPAFTGIITGIKNGDNISATYSTTATATSPVGTYPIVPALVDPTGKLSNYAVTVSNGTLTITNSVLTVTAANASRLYGDPNPVFTGAITGIKNGDNITATYASTATATSAVGTFSIVPTLSDNGTGALANYTVVINNGVLTVNQAPLTVSVANATRLYGVANPAFTGTITGLKNADSITATYSATATATSNVGTYPITATLSDPAGVLPNYAVITNNGTLTITPAPLTVTAANATRVYGDANPAFTGTITGLLNGDNITATYSTTATAASNVGTYPITPALVDPAGKLGNYTVTSNNGTLTVTTAPLTVTAANATRAFGDPNPAFTGIITGIKNGDNITASYSTTATASSPVGTYPITPALVDPTGKLGNYTVTSNNGTLTITNSVLTVTAANASRFYGDPNPAFTGTITGLKNGDNITATFSSAATATSAPGTYAIVATLVDPNNRAGNYTIVINNGALTVNAAPLSVAAANATRGYGAANPVFTGTITGLKNGDNITASYTTVADPTSNVGSYAITPLLSDPTNKLSNYAVTLTNGSLTITPAPLTATANNASRVYGDPNPAFTGTITGLLNGDNITFSATSAAPTAAVGTYPIVPALVDPAGKLANYTLTSNNGVLTVTPAPLSVAAANATRAYGDPNPAFTGTLTGIKNGDNITATYSTTAVATSAPGSYPITPALADPTAKLSNYTVTSTNGTLTVTTATLTVSATNASMIYGDPVPALSGTITGLKNGDSITAAFSTTATSASPVGTYPITSALSDPTGKLANYTLVTNNGVLTISPAPLTVSTANASRAYGSANPAFTGTLTGVKNGDNITATFASATDATTNVGNYPIVPTLVDPTAKLGNYTVTSTNGTLTITQIALSVTANNATRVYGDPNPAFTGTITGLVNGDNITFSATSADPTAAVGTYPIVPTLVDPNGKLVNYTLTSNNGTLTVTPAPLTVAAANSTRAYGDPNNLSGTITGIKNGDNITATYSTTATATSVPGTYPITPSLVDPTAKLGNYTVSSSNATLTVTPATLTVSAANASMVFGDAVPALSGTIAGIKNGDNITASYSTAATSTSAPGTYPIIAAVSDNGTGALANYTVVINNGTLTISPAPLVVTAANASRLYGDPNPGFTGTITGLKNGDNIGAIFSAAADPTSPVGNYAIIPTLTDPNNELGNYSVTLNNGVLAVSPAPLSVTAADSSRLYGDPNPAFTGTLTGIKNGDNITASFSSAADPTSPVGTYPIVPSLVDPTSKLANYVVTSTNGTLTILQAPLTIQANDATGTAGQPFPTFTGTITGLKNTDVITASYSTTADQTSPAGTYPIIPAADPSPALANYAVTLINGTLTLQ
jgi:6-phosphogluconolactonase (cycloisomerase 2 family)